jgi:spore germination protein YaaH
MITILATLALVTTPKVSAWVVGYNAASVQRLKEKARQLDIIYTEYYAVDKNGTAFRRAKYAEMVKQARETSSKNGVEFFVMANNYSVDEGVPEGFEATRLTKAFATSQSRSKLCNDLVKMVLEDKAVGLDLDFESLSGKDRDKYSSFAAELARELHKKGKKLSVTVHPKQDVDGGWDGAQAHDYAALGKVSDRLNIMTYDFSWSTSPAGPIAPLDWVGRVIDFAISQVPAGKLGMGIACYGYDYKTKPAESISWEQMVGKKTTIEPLSGELRFEEIRFSGAKAFQAKYDLAKKKGVGAVAFWYCGSEEPGVWNLIPKR